MGHVTKLLLRTIMQTEYIGAYMCLSGMQFLNKFTSPIIFLHYCVQITVWDTAGVERFRTVTRNFFRNTNAVLLVFSVDEPPTLSYLSKWEEDVKEYAPTGMFLFMGVCPYRYFLVYMIMLLQVCACFLYLYFGMKPL